MNESLTTAELLLLIELEKEATPAPWTDFDRGHGHSIEPSVAWVGGRISFPPQPGDPHVDAALIVVLRNAVPRLLLELLALREENERLRSYTMHRRDCDAWCIAYNDDGGLQSGPCSCGFEGVQSSRAQKAHTG